MQGHIVISWHNDFRTGNRIEKFTRLHKLLAARALRQVARDRNQIRLTASDKLNQRLHNGRIGASEVQIGKVDQDTHHLVAGMITRSAPGRDR